MSPAVDRGNPKTLIGIDNHQFRESLAVPLRKAGFEDLTVTTSRPQLEERLQCAMFDLVIVVAELGGDSVVPLFADLRDGKLSHHPFPIVITLVTDSHARYIKTVMEGGPDSIILMPVSPSHLLTHIDSLGTQRKCFVVIHDYTGPERRRRIDKRDDDANPVQKLDVPNPLKARQEKIPPDVWLAQIKDAATTLRAQKAERYAAQIEWVSRSLDAGGQNFNPAQLLRILSRLKMIADDLSAREDKQLIPVTLWDDLTAVAQGAGSSHTAYDPKDFAGLTRACSDLAQSLQKRLQRSIGDA